ncbi:hypothetical protein BVI2075_280058 [Burkholderia vietnamiensis]|nr:hypothetical protein BVI2075_280058 [Burkholderia vietnamiensis]
MRRSISGNPLIYKAKRPDAISTKSVTIASATSTKFVTYCAISTNLVS